MVVRLVLGTYIDDDDAFRSRRQEPISATWCISCREDHFCRCIKDRLESVQLPCWKPRQRYVAIIESGKTKLMTSTGLLTLTNTADPTNNSDEHIHCFRAVGLSQRIWPGFAPMQPILQHQSRLKTELIETDADVRVKLPDCL